MQFVPTGTVAGSRDMERGAYRYQRHQPENNPLYRIIERHQPEFTACLAEQGATAARFVQLRASFKTHFLRQRQTRQGADRSDDWNLPVKA